MTQVKCMPAGTGGHLGKLRDVVGLTTTTVR